MQIAHLGQILIAVDYAMKSIWHGACVAQSMRIKLSERWRNMLGINTATGTINSKSKSVITEFNTAGLLYF